MTATPAGFQANFNAFLTQAQVPLVPTGVSMFPMSTAKPIRYKAEGDYFMRCLPEPLLDLPQQPFIGDTRF